MTEAFERTREQRDGQPSVFEILEAERHLSPE